MADNRYCVEYANTGRASCKDTKCLEASKNIPKGFLRVGKVSPSPFAEDAEMTSWYHFACAFNALSRARASTKKIEQEDDLEGFDQVKAEDQKKLRELIAGALPTTFASQGKGKTSEAKPSTKGKGKVSAKAAPAKKAKKSPGDFTGFVFCILGDPPGHSRDEIHQAITGAHGTVAKSVTKKVTHVICAPDNVGTGKYNLAQFRELPILSAEYVFDYLKDSSIHLDDYFIENCNKGQCDTEAEPPKKKAKTGKLHTGRVFAITGTLSRPRKQIVSLIEKEGGKFASTVSKSVTHLVAANPFLMTAKMEKAQANGVTIVGEDFIKTGELPKVWDSKSQVAKRKPGIKWQFEDYGWHDYDDAAMDIVEAAYQDWKKDPFTNLRAVKSGTWMYTIDFSQMEQTNVQHPAHTTRKVQRCKS